MDIIDTINVFTTMYELEILFLAYNISRCYTQGQTIRDAIEANSQTIAAFNGYEGEFASFRDLVDWHNFVCSPLQNLARSGSFIVTDAETPFPYSAEEFLRLLNKTPLFTGMVVLNYPEDESLRLPEIKYRILKTEAGFEFVAPPTKPETNVPSEFFDQRVDFTPSVSSKSLSEFIAQLQSSFKEQTFGGTGGVCGLRFCFTFCQAIDQLLYENLGVHILPNIYNNGMPLISVWCSDAYRSDSDYEVSYALEGRYKGDLLKLEYRSVMVMESDDPNRADLEGPQCFNTTPYATLRDPQPYAELPLQARYTAYLLSVVKWKVNRSTYGKRKELLKKDGLVMEINGNLVSCYDGHGKTYLASYHSLSEEEISEIKTKYNYTVSYSLQHAEMYFYQVKHQE